MSTGRGVALDVERIQACRLVAERLHKRLLIRGICEQILVVAPAPSWTHYLDSGGGIHSERPLGYARGGHQHD